ncbi:MAG TPA: hypothetical protein VLY23_02240 [Candidatus Acidoferrum sp.]|nr:hypothetical protein [Candidatus Acidoferrum sp.]
MSKIKFSVAMPEEFNVAGDERTILAMPSNLSPLEAYLGLKALFGEPNRKHVDETKQQWAFLIKADEVLIEVYDWKYESWSIGVYEKNKDEARATLLSQELERQISLAVSKRGSLLSSILKTPVGHVIENPFALYYHTAGALTELARQLCATRETPSPPTTPSWESAPSALCRAAFFQLIAAVEGLLNLVYELYLRKELRDIRIVERLAREQVDMKARLAPIYCDCFEGRPIDHTTQAFQNFQRLVNRRNDFIHANLTKSMKSPIVRHDKITFVASPEDSGASPIPGSMTELGIEEVEAITIVVDDLVEQILETMSPRHRKVFRSVMYEDFICIEYDEGVPIILG